MPTLETQPAAELLKAFSHPTRLAILQELVAGPKLVRDMLALVERDEPIIKRTPEQIQADKERLEKALARKARAKSRVRSKVSR
jgi:DNA-binding transcriptional ArsR family regulator